MEQEIYNILKKILYEQNIKKLYEKDTDKFEYPIKIEKITFDVIDIFNNYYFEQYKEILLKNAAIYAIKTNDLKYINLFNNKNIINLINNDCIVRALITQRAFYNINYKIKNNKNIDNEIINNNFNLYKKLNPINNIETFTNKYRKIILNFLNKYDNNELEIILDDFFNTNNYDNEIIEENKFLNKNNINYYKYILFRIILSDNYLYLKSIEKDNNIVNEEYEYEEDEEFIEYIDKEIIEFIENNNYLFPNDYDLRISLYSNFLMYNILLNEHKYDIDNIKENTETIKTLKKVNPYYFLDMLN